MSADIYIPEHQRPHVDTHICGKCRKPFHSGDRVVTAYIFNSAAQHPNSMRAHGAYLEAEFELVHVDCSDTRLVKGYE